MEKTLKLVDAVAEIVDARIPISSRNPVIDQIIQQKPRVILLNKSDMADPAQTKRWIAFYRSKGILAMPIDCKSGKGIQNFIPLVKELLKDRIASWESKGMVCRTIRVMVVGVPNVGKSSLINMLTNNKKLAKTAARPGKTQLINHFLINDMWYMVDLPGYGYARTSETASRQFEKMIRDYILKRENLVCLFVLIDSRLEPQKIDLEVMEWLGENGVPFVMIFTKADKLSATQRLKCIDDYHKVMLETWETTPMAFMTSSEKRLGREEVLDYIDELNRTVKL